MKTFSSTHYISFTSQHSCKERIHRLSGCHIRYDATTLMFSPCLRTLCCQDSCFTDFEESTSHLWETMVQVMVWLGQLAELQLVTLDDIENLSEFCRTVLERIGNRPGLFDTLITWLAGARMAIFRVNGIQVLEMKLGADDLFLRSLKLRPLSAYWRFGTAPPAAQSAKALQFLLDLKDRQVENRNLVRSLNAIVLLTFDIQHLRCDTSNPPPNLEVTA